MDFLHGHISGISQRFENRDTHKHGINMCILKIHKDNLSLNLKGMPTARNDTLY